MIRVPAAIIAAMFAMAPAVAACPNAGLKTRPVVLVTAKGPQRYTLEIAGSEQEQECGLMYRKAMPRNVGMIFPFPAPRRATFWMENTVLPLDLVFVGTDGRVLSIADGKPFSRDIIDSRGIAASVIELNAGEAKRIGLRPGDRIEY